MKAKFKIGDSVHCPKDLYGNTTGTIVKIDRLFKEVDENGKFIKGGLVTEESSIASIVLPHTFEDNVLSVTFPAWKYSDEHIIVSKFYKYSYTIMTNKHFATLYPEDMLKRK